MNIKLLNIQIIRIFKQKRFFTVGVFLLHFQFCFSQNITNYAFSASSGTYTAISGSTQAIGAGVDDSPAANISIGFDFFYMGTGYTKFGVSSNGWMTLGSSLSSSSNANNLTSGGTRPVIAPLWDDLKTGAAGKVHYVLSGSSPNSVLTVEWKQMRWNYQGSDPCISFQVKLYETTGVIDFIYNQEANAPSSASASIGISASATGSGNFLSLDGTGASPGVSSTTETTSLSARPASGQTYTFTPPAGTTAPSAASYSCIGNTAMTLNWTNNGSNQVGTAIYKSTDNVTFTYAATAGSGLSAYTVTGLTASTTYYWKLYSVSEGYVSSAYSAGSQATISGSGTFWLGGTSTDWGTASNWSGCVVPNSTTTDVTIPSGTTYSPSITGSNDVSCRNLTINSGATLTLNLSAFFYVYGSLSNSGTLTHTNGASAFSNGHWLYLRGTSGATIGGSGTFTTLGLWISNSSLTDITLSSDLTVACLYINSGASPEVKLSLSSYTLIVTTYFEQYGELYLNSGTLELRPSSVAYTTSNFFPGSGTLYRNVSANATSSSAWTNLYNYKISCSGFTFTQSGASVTVTNNFTISAGTYAIGANTLNVGKDFSNSGTFTYGTSTVNFNGSAAQQILGSSATSFYNATLNNATGLTLAPGAGVQTTVRNTLTLTSGKITLGNYDLNIGAGGVSGSISGASSSNYIITNGTGVLRQYNIGTGQRTTVAYPIGYSSSSYTPVTLDVVGATTVDDFSAQVFRYVYPNGSSGTGVTANVADRTWDITEGTTGGSNVTLTPQWPASDELTSFTRNNCFVDHYSGGLWTATSTGVAASGSDPYTVVSGTVTSFSPFAVRSAVDVLPIELLDFGAVPNNNEVDLNWTTVSETNNDYFTVERSADGMEFETIAIVDGAGNSNTTLHYKNTDIRPLSGLSYYRLKQTDFDGKFSYSQIVAVKFIETGSIVVYPNPVQQGIQVSFTAEKNENVLIQLFDVHGKLIQTQNYLAKNEGVNNVNMNLSAVSAGIYFIALSNTTEVKKVKIIKE